MRFADVIGESNLKAELVENLNRHRVSHGQLFVGEQGSSAYPLSLAYASYLLCSNPKDGDSCGECANCYKMDRLEHPDLHLVFPVNDAKSGSSDKPTSDKYIEQWREMTLEREGYISIEEWYQRLAIENKQGIIRREEASEIIRKLSLKSFEGGYKIVIIYTPEAMGEQAANSLLKLLEEPPAKTLFLMVSSSADRIMGTIRSRVQATIVPPLSDEQVAAELQKRSLADGETAQRIAHSAQGNWGRALRICRDDQDGEVYQEFVSLMRLCYRSAYLEIFDWVNGIAGKNREFHKRFCSLSLEMLRDCYMEGIGARDLNFSIHTRGEFVSRFAPFANHTTMEDFVREYDLLLRDITRNGNTKIVFTHFALSLCKIFAIAKMELKNA